MNKLLKPSSITFILLMLVTFLVLGLFIGRIVESGKGHGLAGGAIVLGWGVLFGGIAFTLSFFIAWYLSTKKLLKINWALLLLCLATFGYLYYLIQKQAKEQKEDHDQYSPPTTPTAPVGQFGLFTSNQNLLTSSDLYGEQNEQEIGLGYFLPNFHDRSVLYFYGNLNLEKSWNEHPPYDSITFRRNAINQTEIVTAPPWLVPEIMKLDYDMLYFRVVAVTQDFAEVVVNTHNNQTSFVSRTSGKVSFWPDFLLGVNSVEVFPKSKEIVKIRPFDESSTSQVAYEFLRPTKIFGDWMEVLMLDSSFQTVGKGWLQWRSGNKLLVTFNLLS